MTWNLCMNTWKLLVITTMCTFRRDRRATGSAQSKGWAANHTSDTRSDLDTIIKWSPSSVLVVLLMSCQTYGLNPHCDVYFKAQAIRFVSMDLLIAVVSTIRNRFLCTQAQSSFDEFKLRDIKHHSAVGSMRTMYSNTKFLLNNIAMMFYVHCNECRSREVLQCRT